MKNILANLAKGEDGIYGDVIIGKEQSVEHAFRTKIARVPIADHIGEISRHHSIEVMDYEVKKFLAQMPINAVICDIGGCWGWHWRNVHKLRPDVQVIIVDFCRENLSNAFHFLNGSNDAQVHLVHNDATSLDFPDACFDGVWSVQTLQHIPDIEKAISEVHRVLKTNGYFSNYSLNSAMLIKLVYKVFGRAYFTEGTVEGNFFLRRASKKTSKLLVETFNCPAIKKYSEILFKPELNIHFMGKEKSILGMFDAKLTSNFPPLALIARQQSTHIYKK